MIWSASPHYAGFFSLLLMLPPCCYVLVHFVWTASVLFRLTEIKPKQEVWTLHTVSCEPHSIHDMPCTLQYTKFEPSTLQAVCPTAYTICRVPYSIPNLNTPHCKLWGPQHTRYAVYPTVYQIWTLHIVSCMPHSIHDMPCTLQYTKFEPSTL